MTEPVLTRWLPKTLFSRLVITIMISMTVILTGFAIYTGYRDQQVVLRNSESQLAATAYQVAASSTNHLILDNYAELEELASRFLEYPSLDLIYIYSPDMRPLVALEKETDTKQLLLDVGSEINRENRDMQGKPYMNGDYLEIWYPVKAGELLAWVYMRSSLESYFERINATWINIATAVTLTLLLALFGIRKLLQTNIQRLIDATEYAKHLIVGDGRLLDSRGLTQEVKDLVVSLNDVSKELYSRRHQAERSSSLLDTIFKTQKDYISQVDVNSLFSTLLDNLLDITKSEYGFIGEILHSENGLPYLKTHAITNIAWNKQTQNLYDRQAQVGFEFHNLDTLFGAVITSRQPIVSNDPASHPGSSGLPNGHPQLKAFLGIPFFSGDSVVGMIGIANAEQGYSDEDVEFLRPLTTTCGQIIDAYRSERRRVETEERLKESENMLRQVLNTIPTRVFWKDLDGVYVGCNYNFAQDAGFGSEDGLLGKSDYQMPWASEAASYRHDDRLVINNGIPKLKFEEMQTTLEGEKIWLRTSKIPLRNVEDTIVGILGSYDDITEEKNNEARILESESRLAIAQQIAQVGNWESDLLTGKDLWSEEIYRILGMDSSRKDISYQDFFQTIHPDDASRIQSMIDEHTISKQPYEYEARITSYDGMEKVVVIRGQFDLDKAGEIRRIYGTMQDITERKRMEKMKDEFISTVSHELRTPLTSIKGSLGLLGNMLDDNGEEKLSSLLSIAQNNTDRLLFLINDILDISKIESGHIVFHFQPLDLVAITQEAIANNSSYDNDVRFNFVNPPEHMVWINADRDRILQVIYNLLSNAAKFSPPGGEVDIRICEEDNRVRLQIEDYGVGIAEDFLPKLFDKFTQADSSASRNTGGTGLGLSITKTIIERHHGSIEVESELGKGSTFSVVLPIHRVSVDLEQGKEGLTGPAVLICEDDPDVAVLLKEMLEREGYYCEVANSADQAKKMLFRKQFDAMTLDIMLPGKDGISLLRELRREPQFEGLNVIIVSVKADEAHAQLQGSALGVQDWLSKPIDEQRLLSVMHTLLDQKQDDLPHILHVEDDQDLVNVVKSLLEGVARIDNAATLDQARSLLAAQSYDLILLDLNLPDGSGLDLMHVLQGQGAEPPVVIFSSEEVEMDAVEQVKAVLLKSRADNAKLVQTIHQLIAGASEPDTH